MIDVKRALVDLAKDRNGVPGIGTKDQRGLVRHRLLEGEFGTRKEANSNRIIFRRGEPSCAGAEIMCDEFFAYFGLARSAHCADCSRTSEGTPFLEAPDGRNSNRAQRSRTGSVGLCPG